MRWADGVCSLQPSILTPAQPPIALEQPGPALLSKAGATSLPGILMAGTARASDTDEQTVATENLILRCRNDFRIDAGFDGIDCRRLLL